MLSRMTFQNETHCCTCCTNDRPQKNGGKPGSSVFSSASAKAIKFDSSASASLQSRSEPFLVAFLLLVQMPGATSSVLAPFVAMPFVTSSFLLLVGCLEKNWTASWSSFSPRGLLETVWVCSWPMSSEWIYLWVLQQPRPGAWSRPLARTSCLDTIRFEENCF